MSLLAGTSTTCEAVYLWELPRSVLDRLAELQRAKDELVGAEAALEAARSRAVRLFGRTTWRPQNTDVRLAEVKVNSARRRLEAAVADANAPAGHPLRWPILRIAATAAIAELTASYDGDGNAETA